MSDLHTEGWRQGSVFRGHLPATYLSGDESSPQLVSEHFDRWVVCTQDCDLASSPSNAETPLLEIRPIFNDDPPSDWGIRSRKLQLSSTDYVEAGRVLTFVSPKLLSSFAANREPPLSAARALALKTWLGLRYDRPAVPPHLVAVAKEVAKRCGARSGRDVGQQVRDVLMQFKDSDPVQIALFAVIRDNADHNAVEQWLADAARRIRTDLGVVASIEVGTRAEASLELIETSYAADLSQLTWQGEDPTGVT